MSMPGMMDTVLNVGLNDVVVEGLAKQVNDRFAWDCYRRLLQVRPVLALLRSAGHPLSAP
jgi:pyruvate,orthophosphate dikinase